MVCGGGEMQCGGMQRVVHGYLRMIHTKVLLGMVRDCGGEDDWCSVEWQGRVYNEVGCHTPSCILSCILDHFISR